MLLPRLEHAPGVNREAAVGEDAYRCESAGGASGREIEVNAAGLVTRYPGFREAEPAG